MNFWENEERKYTSMNAQKITESKKCLLQMLGSTLMEAQIAMLLYRCFKMIQALEFHVLAIKNFSFTRYLNLILNTSTI